MSAITDRAAMVQSLPGRPSASRWAFPAPGVAGERLTEGRARRLVREREIDLGRLEIDACHRDSDAARKLEDAPGALADERVSRCIEMEVVATELGHVHEAVDREIVERDEDPEACHAADRAGERLADLVLHEVALEPRLDVARRVVGAPFGERTMLAQLGP